MMRSGKGGYDDEVCDGDEVREGGLKVRQGKGGIILTR